MQTINYSLINLLCKHFHEVHNKMDYDFSGIKLSLDTLYQ